MLRSFTPHERDVLAGLRFLIFSVVGSSRLVPYFRQYASDGGAATESQGRCRDFNLMLRKGLCRGELRPIRFAGRKGVMRYLRHPPPIGSRPPPGHKGCQPEILARVRRHNRGGARCGSSRRRSGGTTTQIAIFPSDTPYSTRDFLWRVSSAVVTDEKSIFTPLPDYNLALADFL